MSGRPQVLLMLERLIEYINGHEGVRWVTMEEVAEDFRYTRSFTEDEDLQKCPECEALVGAASS